MFPTTLSREPLAVSLAERKRNFTKTQIETWKRELKKTLIIGLI